MSGNKKSKDPSARELAKMYRLADKSTEAFAKGDIEKAMRLGGQAAAINRRSRESYDRHHPGSPRYGS